jgi:hypothetical protein
LALITHPVTAGRSADGVAGRESLTRQMENRYQEDEEKAHGVGKT